MAEFVPNSRETLPMSDMVETGDSGAGFEEIEHTADRALRVCGRNFEELLISAARGMLTIMNPAPSAGGRTATRVIDLDALDAETLLVNWLSELAFWAETEMLVFDRFDVEQISPTHLRIVARGGRTDRLERHVKAVTFHNLDIVRTPQGLTATVVFDV
jgi:SHS2 domain-containing protein